MLSYIYYISLFMQMHACSDTVSGKYIEKNILCTSIFWIVIVEIGKTQNRMKTLVRFHMHAISRFPNFNSS